MAPGRGSGLWLRPLGVGAAAGMLDDKRAIALWVAKLTLSLCGGRAPGWGLAGRRGRGRLRARFIAAGCPVLCILHTLYMTLIIMYNVCGMWRAGHPA